MKAQKPVVKIAGVAVSGNGAIAWRFVTGVRPYVTTLTVRKNEWESKLDKQRGKPTTLDITDSRGVTTKIEEVYILHTVPSDSPARVSFLVSDKRWKWSYSAVHRDYNIARRTGDKTAKDDIVPYAIETRVDRYDYLSYSLKDETERWTPKEAVKDILEKIDEVTKSSKKSKIESFPIEPFGGKKAGVGVGEFTLQNVRLRDQVDVALSRLLSYIPGASIYIAQDGTTTVFDGADLDAADKHFDQLPPATWAGEAATNINRKAIRPSKVRVLYEREVEVLLEYKDDYSNTQVSPVPRDPYIENVIPTVDFETTVYEYNPISGKKEKKVVPAGTWVRFDEWLLAMDKVKPEGALPWTFETLSVHWIIGNVEGALAGQGGKLDLDAEANVLLRVQMIKQHFRQTFRINRKYVEGTRSIRAIRVALLDPVSGARAPAAVWGQSTIIPTNKDWMTRNVDRDKAKAYRTVDYLKPSRDGKDIIGTPPGPTRVNFIDAEIGIFRLEWVASPFGLDGAFIPGITVDGSQQPRVVSRDLAKQDEEAMGMMMQVEGGSNGVYLAKKLEYKILITMVPATPNNTEVYHKVEVKASDVSSLFRREFRIQGGEGPELEIIVPPGEITARFAWKTDKVAKETIPQLFNFTGKNAGGIDELKGFILANGERELKNHAASVAAELLAPFADAIQGAVATRIPESGEVKLAGNMNAVTIRVAGAPSAKIDLVSEFPGQQKPISRMALMPQSLREVVLGTLPYS